VTAGVIDYKNPSTMAANFSKAVDVSNQL
jgi:hypothetical protein